MGERDRPGRYRAASPGSSGGSRSLRVGIDARAAVEAKAGNGRVLRELLRALQTRDEGYEYVLYARSAWAEVTNGRFRWDLIGLPDPLWHVQAARRASRDCDVLLATNSFLSVMFASVPCVPIVYDLTSFRPGMGTNFKSRVTERLTLGHAVRRSARLLAISQATADELTARFPKARGKVTVAPLGTSPALSPDALTPQERESLPAPGFVLAVGTLEPRKNLPRLAAAYARLGPELQGRHPLVVAGKLGWQADETVGALRSLGSSCRILGYVSDGVLAELYRRCAVFCYPSLGEGFGLPVLEAMAAGAPVLTSDVTSLPEVGGQAVDYADPYDLGALAGALERLLQSPERRARLSEFGPQRAAGFSWERFADLTLTVLTEAARGTSAGPYHRGSEPRATEA